MNWPIWLKELKESWNSIKGSTITNNLEKEKDLMNNNPIRKEKVSPKVIKLNALTVEVRDVMLMIVLVPKWKSKSQ